MIGKNSLEIKKIDISYFQSINVYFNVLSTEPINMYIYKNMITNRIFHDFEYKKTTQEYCHEYYNIGNCKREREISDISNF